MADKLFGTDGVRGEANTWPMTAEMALRLGAAAGRFFRSKGAGAQRVVIGKDTRLSGYMIENALTAGLTSSGMSVFLVGPMPSPAVGFLTRSLRAEAGVMISASHNPATDNGIKFFGPDGFKLSDDQEAGLQALFHEGVEPAKPANIGRAKRIDDASGRYVESVKAAFPPGLRLDGLRVVIDCAHGAAYKIAPAVLWELGAEVISLGVSPDGFNINADCGSTQPQAAAMMVHERRADVGLCLDGDADRLILIDETGQVADGDQLMGLIATRWKEQGRLNGDTLVATVMSNLGLERHLETKGIRLARTGVGDRHVVSEMRKHGYNLGGEQSGHMVLTDHATTGDGLVAGLQFLAAMVETGRRASDLARVFEPVPQKLVNVRVTRGSDPLAQEAVRQAVTAGEATLGRKGRLLIRASGTEPLIRVMGEAEDVALLDRVVDDIAQAVRAAG